MFIKSIKFFDRSRDHGQVDGRCNWLVLMWSPLLHHLSEYVDSYSILTVRCQTLPYECVVSHATMLL